MSFAIPGLMPDQPERFLSDLGIQLRGDLDVTFQAALEEDGVARDLSSSPVLQLRIVDWEGVVATIDDAVSVDDAESGRISIDFGEAARAALHGPGEGLGRWLLVEVTDDGDKVLLEGSISHVPLT